MGSATRPIAAMLVVAAAAIAFWMLLLGPMREESSKLGTQAEQLNSSVEAARSELAQATAAERSFPAAYHQLVELGQAVPASDETPSLLVELETLGLATGVGFDNFQLEGEGQGAETVVTPAPTTESTPGSSTGTPAAATIPPTEVEAALLPLGASIGSAGLGVMPYELEFTGTFFQIANFVGGIDTLVRSGKQMKVDGRLITINGFSLAPDEEANDEVESKGLSGPIELRATLSVTTYLAPPGEGVTAGATPTEPATESTSQTVAAE